MLQMKIKNRLCEFFALLLKLCEKSVYTKVVDLSVPYNSAVKLCPRGHVVFPEIAEEMASLRRSDQ